VIIQALASRIASFIVKNDEEADHEVLAYGYGLVLAGIATYAIVIASALVFGVLREMSIAVLTYLLLRYTVGGVHANSRVVCFLTYAGTMYFCIFMSRVLSFAALATAVLYLFNALLLILYAPSDTVDQPITSGRLVRKLLGLFFLTLLFAISVFYYGAMVEGGILILVSTLTCIQLHPFVYRIYGCKKSDSKEESAK